MARLSVWVLLGLALFTVSVHDLHVRADIPTEYECRPYIEKALHDLRTESEPKTQSEEAAIDESSTVESPVDVTSQEETDNTAAEETSIEDEPAASPEQLTPSEEVQEALFERSAEEPIEATEENLEEDEDEDDHATEDEDEETGSEEDEDVDDEQDEGAQADGEEEDEQEATSAEDDTLDDGEEDENGDADDDDDEDEDMETEDQEAVTDDEDEDEDEDEQLTDAQEAEDEEYEEDDDDVPDSQETELDEDEDDGDEEDTVEEDGEETDGEEDEEKSGEEEQGVEEPVAVESEDEDASEAVDGTGASEEDQEVLVASEEADEETSVEKDEGVAIEHETTSTETGDENTVSAEEVTPDDEVSEEAAVESSELVQEAEAAPAGEETSEEAVDKEESVSEETVPTSTEEVDEQQQNAEDSEPLPEEDLLLEYEIPSNLRDTSHIYELLNINEEFAEKEKSLQRVADIILRDLKRIYDTAIKPLEQLYKYRDLSNRHFGDPEIFSKPLILFMGPWSGGKSTILNYLTHNEYTSDSVRTGAEPSPAYFNIMMHGDEPEVLDGTQLAADWTFSGLQKFGQGLLDRLRGQKLPNKLLERVNIVEIPGILEVRKQVSQYFPFNDACQWFIDRADIIFLVYDPSKLDVGPETEAILDQLKGREYQTRILLNKADQVKPEELLRVQGALIWNISPLMSSAQPPVMYTVSLWSNPFETGAPVRLLQAQERSLLLDLGQAIDRRIENRIASARRFAVRVRNHAKMVDCYLTTYYNHKTLFANKKHISEQIIGNPQQYHIYEGLSTLTNISRYDLPDPDVYRDFFHLNPLYEFKKLSETCTYFRGCPINKLDIAIAYELPELVGKYKKLAEAALEKLEIPPLATDFGRGKSSS